MTPMKASIPPPDDDYWLDAPSKDAVMAWRQEIVTVEHLESQPVLWIGHPIRAEFQEWKRLKQQIQPGDELWTFDSPKKFWRQQMGSLGVVLVRSGIYVDSCVICMN
jgi:hypothetical protein